MRRAVRERRLWIPKISERSMLILGFIQDITVPDGVFLLHQSGNFGALPISWPLDTMTAAL